jgi:hypothetical protein
MDACGFEDAAHGWAGDVGLFAAGAAVADGQDDGLRVGSKGVVHLLSVLVDMG